MPTPTPLLTSISSVDWNDNVAAFLAGAVSHRSIIDAMTRIAIWAKQLETADRGNAALTFVRETQVQGHYCAALISLSLYKSAAAAMRALLECGLYYTYFRTHPMELRTLVGNKEYFVDKKSIIEYHKRHTPSFAEKDNAVGLVSRLNDVYSESSAIVHGQVPGKWVTHKEFKNLSYHKKTCEAAINMLVKAEVVVHLLLLCTIELEVWYAFKKSAKQALLKGTSKQARTILDLTVG